MKTILLLPLLFLVATTLKAQTVGDRLFDTSFLHEIRFESADDLFFSQLIEVWENAPLAEVPYLPGTVRIDGQVLDSVGVRIKGGLSAFNVKRPLKLDFNHYVDGQYLDGLAKINLQNADFDAPMQRDVLCYYIFRQAGVKAPRTAYAKVYFNDIYHGVYILVEQVDKVFLKAQFASEDGVLYKNKTCSIEVASGEQTLAYINEMEEIATSLSGTAFQNAIEQILDTDAFLRFFLIEHFINATDNPIDVGCNYYVYYIPNTQKLYWIPWDLNYALYAGNNYPLFYNGMNNVFSKMLEIPAYRQRYTELACEMLDYLFVEDKLHALMDQNAQLIHAAVEIDPRYAFNIDQFDQGALYLKSLITSRRQDFLDDLNTIAQNCQSLEPPIALTGITINEFMASNDSIGGVADPQGQFGDWIELFNNTSDTVSLYNTYLSNDRDFLKHWRFPDETLIPPGDYLIVWADRDIEDQGLHTDFKLDKSGGEIFLTFEDMTLIDSVSYGEQITNVASARIPNGTGLFTQQNPTFDANNEAVSVQNEFLPALSLNLYPSPGLQTLYVDITGQMPARSFKLRLVNALGQTLRSVETTNPSIALDVQDMNAGIYAVMLECGGQRISKKIFLGIR